MRKNLLIGASALAVFAFANTANAADLQDDADWDASGNATVSGTTSEAITIASGVTGTIDEDVTLTLGNTLDSTDTTGVVVVNGTLDTNGNAVGGGDPILTTTVGSTGTLTISEAYTSNTIDVNGGTLNLSAGTITDSDDIAVTGDATFNVSGGTLDTVVVSDTKTLTFTELDAGATVGTIDSVGGAGNIAFDSTTNDKTFTLGGAVGGGVALGDISIASGDTVDALANDTAITAATVTNAGTLTTGTGALTAAVTNTGTLNLGGDVTGTIDGAGAINVAADSSVSAAIGGTTSVGAITVADNTTLTVNADVTASSITLGDAETTSGVLSVGGAATINSTIDGDADGKGKLTVGAATKLNGNVGATHALEEVSIGAFTLDANTNDSSIAATAVDFTGAGTLELGDGDLTGNVTGDTGTVNLYGTGEVSGTIAAGTVNVGDGTTTNTVNINDDITAAFNVKDKATAVIAADVTFVGASDINGTFNVGSYTVTHTGNMDASAGTLDLGTGTVNTSGTFDGDADTTVKSTVTGNTAYGKTVAQGNVTTNAGTDVALTISGYVADGTELTLVDGSKAGAGAVADLTAATQITDNSSLLSFTQKTADNDSLVVIASRDNTMDSVTTGSGKTAGAALEADAAAGKVSADLNTVIGMVESQGSSKKVAAAVTELAPEVNGAGVEGTLAAAGKVAGTVSNRMEAARGYASLGNTGVASGDEWIKGYGVWGKFFGGYAEQDLRDGIDGYEATTLGFALGADKQFTDNMTAGLALSYANSDVDSKDASEGNNTEIDSYAINLYGTYNNGSPWYVDGQLNFGLSEYDTKRVINFASRTAKGSFDGYQYGAKVGGGYTYDMGSTLVTPMASLQYTRLELDGYTEEGAGGANLKVNEQDYDVLTSELGAKLAVKPFEMSGWTVAPEVHAAWLYDMVKDKAEVTAQFTGGTTSFKTEGKDPAEHTAKVGFGVDVANGQDVTVSVNYDAEIKDEYLGHAGALKVRYDF